MANRCMITGKGTKTGHNVSHANNKTKRKFKSNLHTKRYWVPSLKRTMTLRLSTKAIRLIDKHGIDHYADQIEA